MNEQIDPWFLENLVCPVDRGPLEFQNGELYSENGRRYPVIDGVPVMLQDDVENTIGIADESLRRANDSSAADPRAPEFYLESLGIVEEEKKRLLELAEKGDQKIDPVVSVIVGATSGHCYEHLIGYLDSYPIPEIRLDESSGANLLDLGCNWGRWSIAAARKGYNVIGIDPSLGAVMAARRVAKQLNLPIKYLVADARFIPFKDNSFDNIFSYSVIQHLSKENAGIVLNIVKKILKPGGKCMIQLPNIYGIRCLQHQFKRRFREPRGFEVRYWTVPELKREFGKIGSVSISVDCFFGIGLQKADLDMMPLHLKLLISFSELLRFLSGGLPFLKYVADSVYVLAESREEQE